PDLREELLRAATDSGWRGAEEGLLPRTVREGVLARVEALAEDHAEVLQSAAILGQRFRYDTLAAMTGLSSDVLGDALEAAISAQLIEEIDGELGLCRHLLAARDWRSAAPLFLKAAEEAEAAYSYEDAAEIYGKALEHVEGDLEQAELECRLGAARLQHGEVTEARRRLSDGIERLETAGAHRRAAHFRIQLAVACWQGARLDLA